MRYKSVLTILTSARSIGPQLDAAIAVARAGSAHLEVLCLGVDMAVSHYAAYGGAASMALSPVTTHAARDEAGALADAARARLDQGQAGALPGAPPHTVEARVVLEAELDRLVARRARFADVVVLPRDSMLAGAGRTVGEAALFHGRVPVLVFPSPAHGAARTPASGFAPVTSFTSFSPARVVLAWNDSDQALAAMRLAMPLLRGADLVSVAIVDPAPRAPGEAPHGDTIARFLARHGVSVDVALLPRDLPTAAQSLCRHADDFGADLIVMGAYGHTRFREAIFGGATSDMLERARIPLLLAH